MLKKALIVDDEWSKYEWGPQDFGDNVMLIFAASIEEAREQFAAHPDVAVIVMDACVPGNLLTTLPLVQEIRETFNGPMVAISSSIFYQQQLVEAGCDHKSTKGKMPEKVLEILGL